MNRTQGFTIVEALIAVAILAVIGAAVMTGLMSNLHANAQSEDKEQAASAIRQVFDQLRAGPSLPTTGSQTFTVTQGATYTVTAEFCKNSSPLCVGKAVEVTATATKQGSTTPSLTTETVMTDINGAVQ